MKKELLTIFALAGALFQTSAFANDAGGQQLQPASELIGAAVRNQQDEKIATVKDLMVNLQYGQAPFAVLSSGGFFGVGDRLLAVPLAAFELSAEQDELMLSMDRERIQSAPSFDNNSWPNMNDPSWSSEVYSFYDAKPMESSITLDTTTTRTVINEAAGGSRIPGHSDSISQRFGETTTGLSRDRTPRQGLGAEDLTRNEQKVYNPGGYAESDVFFRESAGAELRSAGTTTTTQELRTHSIKSGKITRASELIGMEVKNAQDDRLGEIKDVIIDMKSGRVAYAVMNPDASLAAGDKLLAVPPTVFTRGADERWLIFNADKQTLMAAPSFEKNDWAQANNPQFTTEVYRFYHQKPYWQTSRDVTEPSGTEQNPYRHNRPDSQELQNDQGANDQNQINEPSGAGPAAAPASDPTDSSDPATEPRSQVEPERNETLSPPAGENEPDSSAAKETAEEEAAAPQGQSQVQEPAGAATSTTPATSDDQATSDADRRLSQQLRNTLQTDPALSASASKVQVSAANGRITLRGSVATEEEKQAIASKAQELVGGAADKVDNQIQVGADALSPATPAPVPVPNP